MSVALITHPVCLEHVTPEGHPEQVARLRSVLAALEAEPFQDLIRLEAPEVSEELIAKIHDPGMIARSKAAAASASETLGPSALDADTWVSPRSWEAALRSAGAAVLGVDMVMSGEVPAVFCATRPPGHHAELHRAMGFCLINNAAAAAVHAMEAHGVERVAIVDFDVHHGNGTQDIFERDGRVLYASTHQWPCYPGTGAAHETGMGNIVNAPLPPGSDSTMFREAFDVLVLPALARHQPELVIISAGFDAHAADPLAQLRLTERDFAWATDQLCRVAREHARGRVVSTLEGGYDLQALAKSAAAHVTHLMMHGVAAL